MKNRKYLLMLDLKEDTRLISEYEEYHKNVWPEVLDSIEAAGILEMEIYRWETRLVMMIEANDDFSFEKKNSADLANARVMEWEKLMGRFQKSLPGSELNGKWQIMKKIFET